MKSRDILLKKKHCVLQPGSLLQTTAIVHVMACERFLGNLNLHEIESVAAKILEVAAYSNLQQLQG